MKKEYLILILVIAGLCAYIFTHNENRNNYTLPELKTLKASDLSAITIEKNGEKLRISKTNDVWGITKKAYPADVDKINSIIKSIKDLRITALVSEKKADDRRYQLDSKNRIKITAETASGPVRIFDVGKTALSYNHTFVRLDGDDKIYHAAGNFRRDVEGDLNDFRNKQVISFEKNSIKAMELSTAGIFRTLSKGRDIDKNSTTPPDSPEDTSPDPKQPVPKDNKDKTAWIFQDDNSPGAEDKISELLSTLSSMECDNYTTNEDKESFEKLTILCRILLKGDKEILLTLFEKDTNDKYPAISSESPFPFVLDTYQGENLITDVENILGIEKDPEDADKTTNTQP